ncbi:hypothetical protein [Amycolatopsis pigmentata]|uniref:Uncharacterized protein n=1 Tax=Amycolatopsis pigmentata TaxID=450801 RepID=A0ABW5G257_9PSEU
MPETERRPKLTELSWQHRALLAVDIESSSDPRRHDVDRVEMKKALSACLESAFLASGIDWSSCAKQDTGDGMAVITPPFCPKRSLLNPLLATLARELRAHNDSTDEGARFRLRVAIHAGDVPVDGDEVLTSLPFTVLKRLLDAKSLRKALAESPRDITVAALISDDVYQAVRTQGPFAVEGDRLSRVAVREKETRTRAWVYVPGHVRPWLTRRRTAWIAVAAAVVSVAVCATVALWPADPVSVIGDPREADPCALTDAPSLTRFGEAERDAAYGGFGRCDVIVRSGSDSKVDLKVELANPVPREVPLPETVGAVGIQREPLDGGECVRTLTLADGYRVRLTAHQTDNGQADLCAIADTATKSAVDRLSGGQKIPRRPAPDPSSLIHSDACALLDTNALARYPGVDAVHPDAGFGRWSCRWHSTTTPGSLLVRFDRNQPLNADNGTPVRIAGRQAFVDAAADQDTCEVDVVYRQYSDTGSPIVELLVVAFDAPWRSDQRCDLATSTAEAAAANLPR